MLVGDMRNCGQQHRCIIIIFSFFVMFHFRYGWGEGSVDLNVAMRYHYDVNVLFNMLGLPEICYQSPYISNQLE